MNVRSMLRVCVWTDRGHVAPCRRSGGRARKEQTSAGRDGGHAPRHPEHVNTSRLARPSHPRATDIDIDTRTSLARRQLSLTRAAIFI